MSDKEENMVLYVGTYTNENEAQTDYEALLALHAAGWVGAFDVGIVEKDDEGKLHIKKHTTDTSKGTWTGMGIGALVGLIFPASVIGAGALGAGAGAAIGHSMNKISKEDLQEIGEVITDGGSALVILGESEVEKMIAEAVKSATKEYKKEFEADSKDLQKAIDEASKEVGEEE